MNFAPGDVQIPLLSINGLDVRPRVSEISVYEHVMKPYSTVVAQVVDSADLLNRLLNGTNDTLSLSFGQPGQDPYSGDFAITSVEKARAMQNLRTQVYTVVAYSTHMTRFPRVQKAYKNMTGTDIVRDLVSTFLSPLKPLVINDPSRGVFGDDRMPFNVNGVQVHKAIRGVLERAVSSLNQSSAYLFYENKFNMVLDTVENMLDKSFSSPTFSYYQRPMGQNWLMDQYRQNFTILGYKESSRSDRSDLYQSLNQEVNPFDIFSSQNDKIKITDGDKNLVSTIINTVYNSMRPMTTLAQVIPARKQLASKLDSQNLTIHVPLNVEATVGTGINVSLLAALGDTSDPVMDSLSGPMMISELRHIVRLGHQEKMQGSTVMMGVRGGMN